MKHLLIAISALTFSTSSFSKELPNVDLMISRINDSGFTISDKWAQLGEDQSQLVNNGVIIVNDNNVSSMIEIKGESEAEVFLSYSFANLHCVNTSLSAINMLQNETLKKSMMESFTSAIGAYENKASTLVWGYHFKTKLTKTKLGLIASCSIR